MRVFPVVLLVAFSAAALAADDASLAERVRRLEDTVTTLQAEVTALKARPSPPSLEPPQQEKAWDIPVGASPVQGNADAPLHLVVFTDFQCPFCARVAPLLQEVLNDPELKGRINVVYKHFPLSFHANAKPAALMSMAVRELGGDKAFWAYAALLFENQRDLSGAALEGLADRVGVRGQKAANLVRAKADSRFAAVLADDLRLAVAAHVRGTPSLFVNGWELRTRSVDGVKLLIKEKNLL